LTRAHFPMLVYFSLRNLRVTNSKQAISHPQHACHYFAHPNPASICLPRSQLM